MVVLGIPETSSQCDRISDFAQDVKTRYKLVVHLQMQNRTETDKLNQQCSA